MPDPKPPKIDLKRREMPKQPPEVRKNNFSEVALGYSIETAVEEARRCLDCKKPKCVTMCPVEIDIPGFVKCIVDRNFTEGVRILKDKNCLPAVCGRVCPQEEQCEAACVLLKKGGEIAIGRLERFLADWEAEQGEPDIPAISAATGKSVAIVGAGPAGLTVAGDLIKLGHRVTIFEALHEPGGVLVYGIPEFRLPRNILDVELQNAMRMGVELRTGAAIGSSEGQTRLSDLQEQYDAVLLATGSMEATPLPLQGIDSDVSDPVRSLDGVEYGLDFLVELHRGDNKKVGKRVFVVGAGFTALDCARVAKRLGAEEVTIRAGCFDHAIGVQEQAIAGLHGHHPLLVAHVGIDPQRQVRRAGLASLDQHRLPT